MGTLPRTVVSNISQPKTDTSHMEPHGQTQARSEPEMTTGLEPWDTNRELAEINISPALHKPGGIDHALDDPCLVP